MASGELYRTDSYQYPNAHVGHLLPVQQSRLDAFKRLCEETGYYKPVNVETGESASHDDETLLRYLRARRFIPKDALQQFKDTEDWRRDNKLDELYETIDVQEYDETRRLYPQWTGRRDKRGIPVYVFEVAHLNQKNMAAYEQSILAKQPALASKVPTKMLRLFALYENLIQFVLPLCTAVPGRPHPETPISQSNNIVDISKVGLKQFWNLKGHMQDASTLATAYYPETLDRIFIIGAPSFFPTVWGWIKRWFDPITVSKIFILSPSNMKSTLEKYIDPENIPKIYGGKLDYEFGMMPVLEPIIQDALRWESPLIQSSAKTFPTGPLRWERYDDGGLGAVAVGSENGKRRHQVIARIEPDAAVSQDNGIVQRGLEADSLYRTTTGTSTQPLESGEAVTPEDQTTPPWVKANGHQLGSSEQQVTPPALEVAPAKNGDLLSNPSVDAAAVVVEPSTAEPTPNEHKSENIAPSKPIANGDSQISKATAAATNAYQAAANATTKAMEQVGLSAKPKNEEKEPTADKKAKAASADVKEIDDSNVEKYLRSQYSNGAPAAASA